MSQDSQLPLRILQITDLHLMGQAGATIYGTDSFVSLRAVLDAALALADPPTVIIATGDLSEDGSDASYERLRPLLLDTGLTTYVIPGNHDEPHRMERSLLGGPIHRVPVVDLGSWRVVMLDSCVSGEPHGWVSPAQLEILSAALEDDSSRPVLTCLHHSPVSRCPSSGCRLHNAAELLRLLASQTNARAVTSGHAHVAMDHQDGPTRFFITPATCSQARHPRADDAVDHEDFWASHRFDPSRHGFRMLTLGPRGELDTEVHWVAARTATAC